MLVDDPDRLVECPARRITCTVRKDLVRCTSIPGTTSVKTVGSEKYRARAPHPDTAPVERQVRPSLMPVSIMPWMKGPFAWALITGAHHHRLVAT